MTPPSSFDFIGPNDKPALLGITSPEPLRLVSSVLAAAGYKVHAADDHAQFEGRFNQVHYQVIVIEEDFCGGSFMGNSSLHMIQTLPMAQRRHGVFFLIGPTVDSLNGLQAFTQSVHCVLNFAELDRFAEVVQKTVAENDVFLAGFRETQRRVYQKAA